MTLKKVWYEDDSFWESATSVIFSEKRLSDATTEINQLISLCDIKPKMHILDLCCGVGRHSLELARRGFRVTGVDRTQSYLDFASQKAKAENLKINFIKEDMRKFCQPDSFDVVINLFTSFGYFEDHQEDRLVVKNVYNSLKAGGIFIMDTMGKEILARIFRERDWREEDGILILEERKITEDWSTIKNHWIMIKGNKRTDLRLSLRLYSAAELSSLLKECGFKKISVYGDLEGNPYDNNAKRLVAVAIK